MPYKDINKQKEYQQKYQKQHYQNNKEIYKNRGKKRRLCMAKKFFDYKSNLSCLYCGKKNPECIDFHHNGDKHDNVGRILRSTQSWNRAIQEIKKCDAVCANCHRKLHKQENKKYLETANSSSQQYKREIMRWFYAYKSTLKCEICGENESCCIDFHHIKNKIMKVSECAGHGWSKKKIIDEINKCRVLCANCHRILHFQNGSEAKME